jgi:endonuclease/exonuclease/phosphatase family metal-dependent hydrolase
MDVLCLQEVHFYDGKPDPQLIEELRSAGLQNFAGFPLSESHLDKSAQLGVGVASARPLRERDTYLFSNPGLEARVRGQWWVLHDKGMIGCELTIPDGTVVQVYSLHLFPFHEFGVPAADDLVTKMWHEFWTYADSLASTGRVILAGDFNQEDRDQAANKWSNRDWHFCVNGHDTTTFGLALDEIALSWSPPSKAFRLVPTFSDHHLAIAEIRL